MDLTSINIENLPFIEQRGDQYIEINSEMSLQSVTKTSQDINVQFNATPSKQPADLTPLMCVPIAPCNLTIAPTNVLSNQSSSKQHDASVPLFYAPHSKGNEVIKVPIDEKPSSSPNALPETLTSLMCTTIASTALEDALENELPYQSRDKSPEAHVLLAYLEPLSPSLIEAHTAEQSHPRPDDLSEASVQLVSRPLSPSLIEAPPEDQPTPSLAFQGNIEPSLSLEQTQSSTLPLSNDNDALSNNRVVILSDVPYHGDMTNNKKRNNKATMNPKLWQRNLAKEKREKGESYLGYRRDEKVSTTKFKVKHDVFKPARSLKPPCASANRKYQDLQDLKPVIPERCHTFYDQLPHS